MIFSLVRSFIITHNYIHANVGDGKSGMENNGNRPIGKRDYVDYKREIRQRELLENQLSTFPKKSGYSR